MKWIFFILLIVFSSQSFGQKLEWVKSIEGYFTNLYYNSRLVQDQNRNLITYGNSSSKIDTDPSDKQLFIGENNVSTSFMTKWDENGQHVWTLSTPINNEYWSHGLAIDKKNNIIFSSKTNSPYEFQFKNKKFNNPDSLKSSVVFKMDSDGNLIWNYKFDSNANLIVLNIKTNSKNEIILTGFFKDSVRFNFFNDKGETTFYSTRFGYQFILKLNPEGIPLWFRSINNNVFSLPEIEVDVMDNIYFTNSYFYTASFNSDNYKDTITSKITDFGTYVLKINTNGNFIYSKSIDLKGTLPETGIKTDSLSNLYIFMCFDSIIDVDPSNQEVIYKSKTKGLNNSVLIKWDKNGNYLWSKYFPNIYNAKSLWVDNEVSILFDLNGAFTLDSMGKHSYLNNNNLKRLIYATYNLDGDILNSFQIESEYEGNILLNHNVIRDKYKNLFIEVYNSGRTDFDPTKKVQLFGHENNQFPRLSIAKYSLQNYSRDSLDNGHSGIKQPNREDNLNISFQNPITDYLDLKLDKTKAYELAIYDLNGRKLLGKTVNKKPTAQMDLREFASGIYILNCQSDDRSQSYKIEKE